MSNLIEVKEDRTEAALPLNENLPVIKDWYVIKFLEPRYSEEVRVERDGRMVSFFRSFQEMLKRLTRRVDLYDIGLKKFEDKFAISLEKVIWEWIRMMFEICLFVWEYKDGKALEIF